MLHHELVHEKVVVGVVVDVELLGDGGAGLLPTAGAVEEAVQHLLLLRARSLPQDLGQEVQAMDPGRRKKKACLKPGLKTRAAILSLE